MKKKEKRNKQNKMKLELNTPVQYRNGEKARIIAVGLSSPYSVVSVLNTNGIDSLITHTAEGNQFIDLKLSPYDLIPIPQPPTYRPWRSEEVPIGVRIRTKDRRCSGILTSVDYQVHTVLVGLKEENTTALFNKCEHSLDSGKTWLPCGVRE